MSKPAFIAKNASIYGDVTLKKDTTVWFNVAIRAVYSKVYIGERSNIQDNSVIHVDFGYDVYIGKDVTIGHLCIIHGCHIDDNVIIGMGSTVLNGAKISKNTIVGANSLVTQNKTFPPNVLIMGSPAKVIRELSQEEIDSITVNARNYVTNGKNYTKGKYIY